MTDYWRSTGGRSKLRDMRLACVVLGSLLVGCVEPGLVRVADPCACTEENSGWITYQAPRRERPRLVVMDAKLEADVVIALERRWGRPLIAHVPAVAMTSEEVRSLDDHLAALPEIFRVGAKKAMASARSRIHDELLRERAGIDATLYGDSLVPSGEAKFALESAVDSGVSALAAVAKDSLAPHLSSRAAQYSFGEDSVTLDEETLVDGTDIAPERVHVLTMRRFQRFAERQAIAKAEELGSEMARSERPALFQLINTKKI